eukprot:Gb_40678 [translate_table: standard]
MSSAIVVQGSNLAASQLGPVSGSIRKNSTLFNCKSVFFGKFSFPPCDLRWNGERKGDPRVVFASGDGVEVKVETPEEILSGEWPQNFSMLNFEDLSAHLEPMIFKAEAQPSAFLADVMSKTIYTVTADQLLEDIDHHFANISGLPVINKDLLCIGVISKKDKSKASNGPKSTVGEVMSSPAITLSAEKTVLDAAVLMLKNKIHRIPIVNESGQVVGIVTRTDIFNALEGLPN